jgi:arsenite-transporting ATPase
MDKLYDVLLEKKYEIIVIDSAPTAMVLPLLQLPSITTGFVTRVLGVRKKWMGVLNMLESGFGDAVLNEVRAMRMKAETMRTVLIDPKVATITVVTIPEKAAVMESRRLIQTVESHGVNITSIVINHVMGTGCQCGYCLHKRESQISYIDALKKDYNHKLVATLPDYAGEVKGTGLEQVVRDLYEKGQLTT